MTLVLTNQVPDDVPTWDPTNTSSSGPPGNITVYRYDAKVRYFDEEDALRTRYVNLGLPTNPYEAEPLVEAAFKSVAENPLRVNDQYTDDITSETVDVEAYISVARFYDVTLIVKPFNYTLDS